MYIAMRGGIGALQVKREIGVFIILGSIGIHLQRARNKSAATWTELVYGISAD